MIENIAARRKAYLALISISLLWGYNWVIMKEALRFCDPFTFTTFRVFLGSFVLLIFLAWKQGTIVPKNIPLLLLTGFLATSGGTGVSTWALQHGGAGKTAILVYTMPFWAILLGRPLLSERISGLQWVAVGFAMTGLLMSLAPWHVSVDLGSSLLAILSGLMWGAGSLLIKLMGRKDDFDLVSVTAWQMFLGAIPIGMTALATSSAPIVWDPYLIGALIYNIVFATAAANLLWFYSLQILPTGVATIGTLATPVIGGLAAAVELGERPPLSETLGMLLIVLGIAIISFIGLRSKRGDVNSK